MNTLNIKNLSSSVCKGKLSISAVDFPRHDASELILSRRCKLHGPSDKRTRESQMKTFKT